MKTQKSDLTKIKTNQTLQLGEVLLRSSNSVLFQLGDVMLSEIM